VTPEEQARFEALERRVAELERRLQPRQWKLPARTPRSVAPKWEANVGLNWISRIAVVTVVLALAFFFQYAFENRLITESGRVLIGAIFGTAAFGAGEWFWHKGQRALSQALAAAGAAFFFLSIWAAFGLYHLIPQSAAMILMVLTTAAAGYLAFRYDSPAVALLGLAGGYATPLLLRGEDQPWFVLSYALVLSAGAVAATRLKHWRWPEAVAVLGTTVLYASQAPGRPFYAIFVAAYFGLFAFSGVFIAAEVLAPIALATIWTPGEIGLMGAVALAAVGLFIRPPTAAGAFAGFWIAYLWWFVESGWTPLGVLTAGYALFLVWPLWRRMPLHAIELAMVALNAGFYFAASRPVLHDLTGLFALGVAVSQAAVARLLWRSDRRGAMLAAGTAWVLLVLAAPIQFAGYRVTVIWAAEATAMVWIGALLSERRAVGAGVALLAVVVLRLGLSDSYATSARFLAFAAAAVAFWASTWWIRQGRLAGITYTGGHAVLLWGLELEAIDWARRTESPASFALSVVAAAYAVLLVGGGAARRHAASRLMGIGLIGLVVLKLYLYDVWLLGAFYRMAAFAILGVMLLVMSYLYSRRTGRGPAPREQ
jgi:uncharacterized membrane protein